MERQDHNPLRAVHRTIGTSPEIETISSLQPDYYGENMDLPDVAPGAVNASSSQHPSRVASKSVDAAETVVTILAVHGGSGMGKCTALLAVQLRPWISKVIVSLLASL